MARVLYLLYGVGLLGLLGAAQYRGWGFEAADEAKDVPRSVRNNPGAYRPHYYYGSGRYLHGK
ncbi:MAG: hypothetical protein JWM27_2828 [Gemmatimonadetes bacterium]|nr:hypothetical protein [Gemmatimonadota bacterium]